MSDSALPITTEAAPSMLLEEFLEAAWTVTKSFQHWAHWFSMFEDGDFSTTGKNGGWFWAIEGQTLDAAQAECRLHNELVDYVEEGKRYLSSNEFLALAPLDSPQYALAHRAHRLFRHSIVHMLRFRLLLAAFEESLIVFKNPARSAAEAAGTACSALLEASSQLALPLVEGHSLTESDLEILHTHATVIHAQANHEFTGMDIAGIEAWLINQSTNFWQINQSLSILQHVTTRAAQLVDPVSSAEELFILERILTAAADHFKQGLFYLAQRYEAQGGDLADAVLALAVDVD